MADYMRVGVWIVNTEKLELEMGGRHWDSRCISSGASARHRTANGALPTGCFGDFFIGLAATIAEIQKESLATTENYVAVLESTLRKVGRPKPDA